MDVPVKSAFKVVDPFVPIVMGDNRGILFYSTQDIAKPVKEFSLPPGKYSVESGEFKRLSFPLKRRYINLPPPDRMLMSPENFDVYFAPNPAKCTIDWQKQTIKLDDSFREKPLPEIEFILGHEFGHRFYGGKDPEKQPKEYELREAACDWFSANRMLKLGYNPSQIGIGHIDSLSDYNMRRKNSLINQLEKLRR